MGRPFMPDLYSELKNSAYDDAGHWFLMVVTNFKKQGGNLSFYHSFIDLSFYHSFIIKKQGGDLSFYYSFIIKKQGGDLSFYHWCSAK